MFYKKIIAEIVFLFTVASINNFDTKFKSITTVKL